MDTYVVFHVIFSTCWIVSLVLAVLQLYSESAFGAKLAAEAANAVPDPDSTLGDESSLARVFQRRAMAAAAQEGRLPDDMRMVHRTLIVILLLDLLRVPDWYCITFLPPVLCSLVIGIAPGILVYCLGGLVAVQYSAVRYATAPSHSKRKNSVWVDIIWFFNRYVYAMITIPIHVVGLVMDRAWYIGLRYMAISFSGAYA
jgi:hypothetical protein